MQCFIKSFTISWFSVVLWGVAAQANSEETATLERLYGVRAEPEGVWIRVISNGCTTPESFAWDQQRLMQSGELAIMRIKPDRCRRKPFQKWLLLNVRSDRSMALKNPVRIILPVADSSRSASVGNKGEPYSSE